MAMFKDFNRNETISEENATNQDFVEAATHYVSPEIPENVSAQQKDTEITNESAEVNISDDNIGDDVRNIMRADLESNEDDEMAVKLSEKIAFEGRLIKEIDLSGIEKLGAKDLKKVEKLYRKHTKNLSAAPETTLDYAIAMASYLTKLPVEFLECIPAPDALKIKNRVINFLYKD